MLGDLLCLPSNQQHFGSYLLYLQMAFHLKIYNLQGEEIPYLLEQVSTSTDKTILLLKLGP